MSDEDQKPKRTRKANPFTTWKKAQAAADRARRAAQRTAKLAAEAEEARKVAADAAELLSAAELEEQTAYTALQEALKADEAEAGE